MYATGEGGYAKDYSSAGSRNSVFTESLLEHLGTPGLSLDELRRKVTMAVMEKTKQAQRPESHDSTNQAIYLVGQEDEEETASGHELLRTTTSVEELRARIAAAEAKVEVVKADAEEAVRHMALQASAGQMQSVALPQGWELTADAAGGQNTAAAIIKSTLPEPQPEPQPEQEPKQPEPEPEAIPALATSQIESFAHIAPDGERVPFARNENALIADARRRGDLAVRLKDVQLPSGAILRFEVRFGTNARSRLMPTISPSGMCQVNLSNDNTRIVEEIIRGGGGSYAPSPGFVSVGGSSPSAAVTPQVDSSNEIHDFLVKANIAGFFSTLVDLGAMVLDDLRELSDADLQEIGMRPVEMKRFHRFLSATTEGCSDADPSAALDAAESAEAMNKSKHKEIYDFLVKANVAGFFSTLVGLGATRLVDLRELSGAELQEIGMRPVQVKRFHKHLAMGNLTAMGFSDADASAALDATDSIEAASDWLLQGGTAAGRSRMQQDVERGLVGRTGSTGSTGSVGSTMEVQVPAGIRQGDTMSVLTPDGRRQMDVVVPAGITPGARLSITVSAEDETEQTASDSDARQYAEAQTDFPDPTPLHLAATEDGQAATIQQLITAGVDTEARTHNGTTALHLAASYGQLQAVEALARAGADVNSETVKQLTPLHLAASHCHTPGVNPCAGCNVIRGLLQARANPAARDSDGDTPLHCALLRGREATCDSAVLMLLEANPNAVGISSQSHEGQCAGRTPLHCAASNCGVAVVRAMLPHAFRTGVMDAMDESGDTALSVARYENQAETAALLVNAGADPTLRDRQGAKKKVLGAVGDALETDETKAAVESAISQTSVASVLAWHPASTRPSVASWLADQARGRVARDQALLLGTRLRVNQFGECVYTGWKKSKLGANDYWLTPDGSSVVTVSLKKLKSNEWSILQETVQPAAAAAQGGAFSF